MTYRDDVFDWTETDPARVEAFMLKAAGNPDPAIYPARVENRPYWYWTPKEPLNDRHDR